MSDSTTTWEIAVGEADEGARLDRFLAAHVPAELSVSRARIQSLIEQGAVIRVDTQGTTVRAESNRQTVKLGETYRVCLPAAVAAEPAAEHIDLDVVFEDRDIIVLDKPAGLVVHPGAGHATGTLVNALIAHCGDTLSGIGGVKRPGIVHRLDKDTSGLLVVAKNDAAHQSLSEQFEAHGIDGRLIRRYIAFAWGVPERPTGQISAALARSHSNRTRMVVVRDESGRHAVTHYTVTGRFLPDAKQIPLVSELSLTLETGRTHQIRVHLAHIGHPILGDKTYGASHLTRAVKLTDRSREALTHLNRQALHAATLGFEHPRTGRMLRFDSKLPPDLAALRRALADEPDAPQPKGARKPPAAMA